MGACSGKVFYFSKTPSFHIMWNFLYEPAYPRGKTCDGGPWFQGQLAEAGKTRGKYTLYGFNDMQQYFHISYYPFCYRYVTILFTGMEYWIWDKKNFFCNIKAVYCICINSINTCTCDCYSLVCSLSYIVKQDTVWHTCICKTAK